MNQVPLRKTPKLRFSEFSNNWEKKEIKDILTRISVPVQVESETLYRQIGIRSHGKGLFYKDLVTGKELGNKRVFWVQPNTFILNIVFAWEQAVAKTTILEDGMIASHRFPMYKTRDKAAILDFILYLFLTNRGKYLLELASPGGAGRNKTLGQANFEELSVSIPGIEEQRKITEFLVTLDSKIIKLSRKIELFKKYKSIILKKIFSKEIRFKDDNGKQFPDWIKLKFSDSYEFLKTNSFSREMLQETGEIKNIHYGDIHMKLPTNFVSRNEIISYITTNSNSDYCQPGDLLIADASEDRKDIGKSIEIVETNGDKIVAGLHTFLARPKIKIALGFSGYLMQSDLVRKQLWRIATGASVLGLSKTELSKITVSIPDLAEQKMISEFLSSLDNKINKEERILVKMKNLKKALLEQIFI